MVKPPWLGMQIECLGTLDLAQVPSKNAAEHAHFQPCIPQTGDAEVFFDELHYGCCLLIS